MEKYNYFEQARVCNTPLCLLRQTMDYSRLDSRPLLTSYLVRNIRCQERAKGAEEEREGAVKRAEKAVAEAAKLKQMLVHANALQVREKRGTQPRRGRSLACFLMLICTFRKAICYLAK